MTNYQPKRVKAANDITRNEDAAREREEMGNSHIDSGSNFQMATEDRGGMMNPIIQIEDMGGVTNVT